MKIAAGDAAGAQQASTGVCTRLCRALLYAVPARASSHFSRPNGNHEAMLHRLCSAYNSCAPSRPSCLDRASTLPLFGTKALKGSGCVKPTISRIKLSGWCFPCLSCPAPGDSRIPNGLLNFWWGNAEPFRSIPTPQRVCGADARSAIWQTLQYPPSPCCTKRSQSIVSLLRCLETCFRLSSL